MEKLLLLCGRATNSKRKKHCGTALGAAPGGMAKKSMVVFILEISPSLTILKFETDINPPRIHKKQLNNSQVTCVVVCWPFWRCRPATMTWFTLRFLSGWLWKTKMNKKHFCWKNTQKNSVDYDSDICHFFWSRRCTRKLPGSTSVNTKWLREIAVQ